MIDLGKVYPRLKQIIEGDSALETTDGKVIELDVEDSPVMQEYIDGLQVAYALDEGSYFRFIANKDMTDGLAVDELHEAAMENMYTVISEQLGFQGDPEDVIMITNGGDYESTMLLVDDGFWDQIKEIMAGGYHVAVPARDILLIAPESNPKSIERLGEMIDNFFTNPEANGLLVRNIYERENGSWTLVKTV